MMRKQEKAAAHAYIKQIYAVRTFCLLTIFAITYAFDIFPIITLLIIGCKCSESTKDQSKYKKSFSISHNRYPRR